MTLNPIHIINGYVVFPKYDKETQLYEAKDDYLSLFSYACSYHDLETEVQNESKFMIDYYMNYNDEMLSKGALIVKRNWLKILK